MKNESNHLRVGQMCLVLPWQPPDLGRCALSIFGKHQGTPEPVWPEGKYFTLETQGMELLSVD